MLKAIQESVYNRRKEHDALLKAFNSALTAHEAALAEWKAHDADPAWTDPMGPMPMPPAAPSGYVRVNPLAWWRERQGALPIMSNLARWFLCIAISAAEVERLFSRAGFMLTSRRNSLGGEKEEMFLLASYNIVRQWKAEQKLGGEVGAEHRVMMARVYAKCAGGLDFDDSE